LGFQLELLSLAFLLLILADVSKKSERDPNILLLEILLLSFQAVVILHEFDEHAVEPVDLLHQDVQLRLLFLADVLERPKM